LPALAQELPALAQDDNQPHPIVQGLNLNLNAQPMVLNQDLNEIPV